MLSCGVPCRLCWRIFLQLMWTCPRTFHCIKYHHIQNESIQSIPCSVQASALPAPYSCHWRCSQKLCRTASLDSQASPAQLQTAAAGPGSGHLWREMHSGWLCHGRPFFSFQILNWWVPYLQLMTGGRERPSCIPWFESVCSETMERILIIGCFQGVDIHVFTTIDLGEFSYSWAGYFLGKNLVHVEKK